jgi:carboxyl-terminal processing protease
MLAQSAMSELSGQRGESVAIVFLTADQDTVSMDLELGAPRGNLSRFGNMPEHHVWHMSETLPGEIGYFRFSMFMDLVNVAPAFNQAVKDHRQAAGMIIDLRGNPGGIGAMAMGMAGWFIPEKGHILGTMISRSGEIKFAVTPRAPVYNGPLAILVDDMSASTSEILAGGLQDLDRARVFGVRTAGAALPSYIEKLPNGDGFQYAVANYISENGQTLEGIGVTPDVTIELNQDAFAHHRDPILQAALEWIAQ